MKYAVLLAVFFSACMKAEPIKVESVHIDDSGDLVGLYKSPSLAIPGIAPVMEYRELKLSESGKYSLVVLGDVAIPEEEEGAWSLNDGRLVLKSPDGERMFSIFSYRHDAHDYLGLIPSGMIGREGIERGQFFVEALLKTADSDGG